LAQTQVNESSVAQGEAAVAWATHATWKIVSSFLIARRQDGEGTLGQDDQVKSFTSHHGVKSTAKENKPRKGGLGKPNRLVFFVQQKE
jgi:hypothetical protein